MFFLVINIRLINTVLFLFFFYTPHTTLLKHNIHCLIFFFKLSKKRKKNQNSLLNISLHQLCFSRTRRQLLVMETEETNQLNTTNTRGNSNQHAQLKFSDFTLRIYTDATSSCYNKHKTHTPTKPETKPSKCSPWLTSQKIELGLGQLYPNRVLKVNPLGSAVQIGPMSN